MLNKFHAHVYREEKEKKERDIDAQLLLSAGRRLPSGGGLFSTVCSPKAATAVAQCAQHQETKKKKRIRRWHRVSSSLFFFFSFSYIHLDSRIRNQVPVAFQYIHHQFRNGPTFSSSRSLGAPHLTKFFTDKIQQMFCAFEKYKISFFFLRKKKRPTCWWFWMELTPTTTERNEFP